MRAVMLEVPQVLRDERAKGRDLFANRGGRMVAVEPVDIAALGVRAENVEGKLRLTWEGGSAEI